MELYLKITVCLLLLVQASHLALLQHTTDSPGKTIDKSWLRDRVKNNPGFQNAPGPQDEAEEYQGSEGTAMESSGIASGSMAVYNEEEENLTNQDKNASSGADDLTVAPPAVPPVIQNVTITQGESPDSSQINMTNTEEEFDNSTSTRQNSTTDLTDATEDLHNSATTLQNSTTNLNSSSAPDNSHHTDLQTTTLAPEGNDTKESEAKPDEDASLTNATDSTSTNETKESSDTATTMVPEEKATTSSPTTVFLPRTTERSPSEEANETKQGSATGDSSERGLETDPHTSSRQGAWGAVLGTMVAVACVGLVAYVILKKKHQKAFSHRKLVEEFPSDPVLRLDNSGPMDLNFGGSAYYNPGLQGDNIQMNNFPGRR